MVPLLDDLDDAVRRVARIRRQYKVQIDTHKLHSLHSMEKRRVADCALELTESKSARTGGARGVIIRMA